MENELLAITLAKMMALNQKYKHCVSKSLSMSRNHFAKNRRLLVNWRPV